MAPPTKLYPFVDRILGGQLHDYLATKRAQGETFERIARQLHAEHDLDISTEQVRQWCIERGIHSPATAEPKGAA